MDAISVLRIGFDGAHGILETTMQDVTPEQAHWAPPGVSNPLGANYAHTVLGEDMMIHGLLQGGAPLLATSWAGKIGVSEPPPAPDQGSWDKWARSVKVDLPAIREYAKAVYADTDQYLGSLGAAGLDKPLDLSMFHLGEQTVGFFLSGILLQHVNSHLGEISCLKGLQGARGYPF